MPHPPRQAQDAACRVVIAVNLDDAILARVRAIEGAHVDVLSPAARRAFYDTPAPPAIDDPAVRREIDAALADADVVYAGNRLPPGLYERAPKLRWVQVMSAGVDRLLARGLVTDRVVVTNSSGVHPTPIGEWVLGAMLAFAKELPTLVRAQQRHEWQRFVPSELRGATCGVVGMGAIGVEVTRLAAAFGMRVLATRRSATAETAMTFVRGELVEPRAAALRQAQGERNRGDVTVLPATELPRLLRESDYAVLCVPLTAETTGLIGAAELALMRPAAVLVNIARGEVIDEAALIAALREGRIRGAALDVFAREPLPAESPLWDMENVLVSPHVSGGTEHYNERAAAIFIDNLQRFVAGQPLRNRIDPARGY